jgi:N-acetylglucosamine kinase-like BadF-type ATPase
MSSYYLGGDLGGSRTRVVICSTDGHVSGVGESGPGNHESVGYECCAQNLKAAVDQALAQASLSIDQIASAGFGVGGYDWPSERQPTLDFIRKVGFTCPIEAVNDTILGLIAGSSQGWGVAIVSGTGCNCAGWDRTHQRIGRVTGAGLEMGEAAGASELVTKAVQTMAYAWELRGPQTRLTDAFLKATGEPDIETFLEGICTERFHPTASLAPMIFDVAAQGDPVAIGLIEWAARELASMAKSVIRQLQFEQETFDVVLLGSMYDGGPLLINALQNEVLAYAPHANILRLKVPPVFGAVLLGMDTVGVHPPEEVRSRLAQGIRATSINQSQDE